MIFAIIDKGGVDFVTQQGTYDEERLVRYLLGQASQEEQAEIEERYLTDPDFLHEVQAVERDLIDRYVHGEIRDPQFETHFLASPARRQKLEFARALQHSLAHAPAADQKSPARWNLRLPALLYVTAAIVILAGGSFLMMNRQDPGPTNTVIRTPEPVQPVAPQPSPATPIQVATFVLTSTLTRNSDETPRLTIESASQVNLELYSEPTDYSRFRALLRTTEGEEVVAKDRLQLQSTASGKAVILSFPASRLISRDYIVKLYGVASSNEAEEIASYYFRVEKK